jgi:hypothetical protein
MKVMVVMPNNTFPKSSTDDIEPMVILPEGG